MSQGVLNSVCERFQVLLTQFKGGGAETIFVVQFDLTLINRMFREEGVLIWGG